jgi:hypothetical protein
MNFMTGADVKCGITCAATSSQVTAVGFSTYYRNRKALSAAAGYTDIFFCVASAVLDLKI